MLTIQAHADDLSATSNEIKHASWSEAPAPDLRLPCCRRSSRTRSSSST